ncbi:hypothetical protein ACWDSJ_28290 [Nocardia sp. NPDC003482]
MSARRAGAATLVADLVFVIGCRGRALGAEVRYCRALRLALLARAQGRGWRRVLRTLFSTHAVTTARIGGHWFLIGPQDPRALDRVPERARWGWYICGPSLDRRITPPLSWEESVPGFLPATALNYCREWAQARASAEEQQVA